MSKPSKPKLFVLIAGADRFCCAYTDLARRKRDFDVLKEQLDRNMSRATFVFCPVGDTPERKARSKNAVARAETHHRKRL